MRTRMRGAVGAGGEKPPATRLGLWNQRQPIACIFARISFRQNSAAPELFEVANTEADTVALLIGVQITITAVS